MYRGREGQWAYILHRISGVAIVLYLLLHVFDISLVMYGPDGPFNAFLAFYHQWPFRIGLILVRVEIDYRSPSFAGDELRVWLRVTELRGSSFVFAYVIEDKASGRLVAEAVSVQAGYDYEAGRVRRLKVLAFEEPGSVAVGRGAVGRGAPPAAAGA